MRIILKLNNSRRFTSINYQKKLTGVIHKWLGKQNEEHGELSLYSFSLIKGGEVKGAEICFNSEPHFFISAHDNNLIKKIIENIQIDPTMFCDLVVREIIMCDTPDLSNRSVFHCASPIFIKRKNEDRTEHVLFDNKNASQYLKETLLRKMELAGINDDSLNVRFDMSAQNAKTKLVHYGAIRNKANVCPVIIDAERETKEFIWNVGLGNSTGIGFGAII